MLLFFLLLFYYFFLRIALLKLFFKVTNFILIDINQKIQFLKNIDYYSYYIIKSFPNHSLELFTTAMIRILFTQISYLDLLGTVGGTGLSSMAPT